MHFCKCGNQFCVGCDKMGKAEDAKTPPNKPQKQIYPAKKTVPPKEKGK